MRFPGDVSIARPEGAYFNLPTPDYTAYGFPLFAPPFSESAALRRGLPCHDIARQNFGCHTLRRFRFRKPNHEGVCCRLLLPNTLTARRFSSAAFRPPSFPKEARFADHIRFREIRVAFARFRGVLSEESIPLPEVRTCEFPRTPFGVPSPFRSRSSFLDFRAFDNPTPICLKRIGNADRDSGNVSKLRYIHLRPAIFIAFSPCGVGFSISTR